MLCSRQDWVCCLRVRLDGRSLNKPLEHFWDHLTRSGFHGLVVFVLGIWEPPLRTEMDVKALSFERNDGLRVCQRG